MKFVPPPGRTRILATSCATLLSAACLHSTMQAAGTTYTLTTTATTTTGNWSTAGWTGGTNGKAPDSTDAGNTAQSNGPNNSTLNLTLDVPVTLGALYVGSQGTTVANWTISADGNTSHIITMDGTGLPVGNTPGAPYAAGVAVIASRSGGTLTINPNVVMNTSLDVGGTSPQTPSGVTINGSITSAASAATMLTFRGQGSTGQSNIASVITVNGNVGASGSSIAVVNQRTSNGGTSGSVVINGNLGPSVTTVTQYNAAPSTGTASTMTLAGTNTYTGATNINAGTLLIRGGAAIPNASAVNMGGGTLSVIGGSQEGSGAVASGGTTTGTNTVGLGALTLTANAVLDFDSVTNGNVLAFASGTNLGTSRLTITNWTSTNYNGTTTSGQSTDDRLIFAQDMSGSLSAFNFGAGAGVGVSQISLGGGFYEVGFAPVPEPATCAVGLLLAATATFHLRRRFFRNLC